MQPTSATDAYAHALDVERLRNARYLALFRVGGAFAMLLLNLFFELSQDSYQGAPDGALIAYGAIGLFVYWVARRSDEAARWSARAIPFIDLPVIYTILDVTVESVRKLGFPDDAAAGATQVAIFYMIFILAASLVVSEAYTWLTAAVAIALQSTLMLSQDRDTTFVCIMALATVLGTVIGLYAGRRSLALVHASVDEQMRREKLGRYFSPQVAMELIARQPEMARGETRDVTVLFADLRDFTALAERLEGTAVVALLNDFHTRMVDRIFGRGGTLDKYIGDGLMAYFGAPVITPDHAEQAVRCAIEMQASLAEMNRERAAAGQPALRLGIGVHSGTVILGDIGAERRREFTAVGDTVNVASRIEQLTKVYAAEILTSEATRDRIAAADLDFAPLEPIAVKGKSEPLRIYRVGATVPRSTFHVASSAPSSDGERGT